MKRVLLLLFWMTVCALVAPAGFSADAVPAATDAPSTAASEAEKQRIAAAAAAATAASREVHAPDFLEQIVDMILQVLNVPASGNTATHYVISALFLVGAFVLRRVV